MPVLGYQLFFQDLHLSVVLLAFSSLLSSESCMHVIMIQGETYEEMRSCPKNCTCNPDAYVLVIGIPGPWLVINMSL